MLEYAVGSIGHILKTGALDAYLYSSGPLLDLNKVLESKVREFEIQQAIFVSLDQVGQGKYRWSTAYSSYGVDTELFSNVLDGLQDERTISSTEAYCSAYIKTVADESCIIVVSLPEDLHSQHFDVKLFPIENSQNEKQKNCAGCGTCTESRNW